MISYEHLKKYCPRKIEEFIDTTGYLPDEELDLTLDKSIFILYEKFISNQNALYKWPIIAKRYGKELFKDERCSKRVKCEIAPYVLPLTIENVEKYPNCNWDIRTLQKAFPDLSNSIIDRHIIDSVEYSKYASAEAIKANCRKMKIHWDFVFERFGKEYFEFNNEEHYSYENYSKYWNIYWFDTEKLSMAKWLTVDMVERNANAFDFCILLKRGFNLRYMPECQLIKIIHDEEIPISIIMKYVNFRHTEYLLARQDFTGKYAAMLRNQNDEHPKVERMLNNKFKYDVEYWEAVKHIGIDDIKCIPVCMFNKNFVIKSVKESPFSWLKRQRDISSIFYMKYLIDKERALLYTKKFLDLIIENGIRKPFSTIINNYIFGMDTDICIDLTH